MGASMRSCTIIQQAPNTFPKSNYFPASKAPRQQGSRHQCWGSETCSGRLAWGRIFKLHGLDIGRQEGVEKHEVCGQVVPAAPHVKMNHLQPGAHVCVACVGVGGSSLALKVVLWVGWLGLVGCGVQAWGNRKGCCNQGGPSA